MKNYHLQKSKDGKAWDLKQEGGARAILKADTKAEAVKAASGHLRGKGQEASLKIHKEDGKLQEERTYPRSADPKGSPG